LKVKLHFHSPLVLGGRKTTTNYIDSIDYIQGNVLRAAFAKYILNNCVEYSPDETVLVNGERKKNWVYYRAKEGCKDCRLKSLCQKFSTLKFSYFYPEEVDILPLTAMVCKLDENHGYIDILTQEKECPVCGKGGRVESASGYIRNKKKYSVKKMFVTKSQIDNYTKTVKDGRLYSVVSIYETSPNSNCFTGYIDGIEEEDLNNIDELRVGKYLSVGYGKCTIVPVVDDRKSRQDILEGLRDFDAKYKSFNKLDNEFNYFAIKLVSDAKLSISVDLSSYYSTEDYIGKWQELLKVDNRYEIYKMYCETFNFRGFDLSRDSEDIREKPVIMLEKGSVILFRTKEFFDSVLDYFMQLKGLGEENENGFGDYIFYSGGVFQ